jgi:hypothetical protein
MRTASPDAGFIDAELKIAALFLLGARRKFGQDPTEANARSLERARADIDGLLDHRLLAGGAGRSRDRTATTPDHP